MESHHFFSFTVNNDIPFSDIPFVATDIAIHKAYANPDINLDNTYITDQLFFDSPDSAQRYCINLLLKNHGRLAAVKAFFTTPNIGNLFHAKFRYKKWVVVMDVGRDPWMIAADNMFPLHIIKCA